MSKHPSRRPVGPSRDLSASSDPCQYSGRRSLIWRLPPRLLRAAGHTRELGSLKSKEKLEFSTKLKMMFMVTIADSGSGGLGYKSIVLLKTYRNCINIKCR